MSTRWVGAAIAVFGMLCGSIWCAAECADPTPGGIKLLPGYKHETQRGIDTSVGKVWKENGLTIYYDIGWLAGNYAKSMEKVNILWYKEQVVGGRSVQFALTKDRMLYVTFAEVSANFYGRVQSEEDITDMLLMIFTYAPPEKSK
jgi:hypothetical protein